MIGTVDCNVQAKYPSMPLDPMQAYVGSPSSIRVRNVPKRIGDWCIRSVQFVAVYPDASIKTAECKLVGCVWVGTIEGTQTSGRSEKGYSIFASGTDENGNEVNGYCLGKGDVEILKADGTIDPDAPAFYVKLLEEQSEDPKPGEMWFNGDELSIVDENGVVKTFGPPDLSDYAKKGDPVSEFFNDANYLNLNTVNLQGAVQKVWNGNIQTATQYINGNCEVWGYYNRREWEYSDGIYREPHVRYDEEGFDDYHWLIYVDASDFVPMPNCWYETEADALNTTEFSFQYGQEQEYVDAFKIEHTGWEKTGDLATKTELNVGLGTKQDKISASGILSGDGQGNITSADMSMYVKQYDSPVFNGLTALGSNYISGYATTAQLKDGLSGKADLSSLSDYYTKTEVDTALSNKVDNSQLSNYALESWVEGKGYLTSVPSTYKTYTDTKTQLQADGFALNSSIKNATITLTQGGVTKGSFTLNQASNKTIDLDAGGGGGGSGHTVTVNFADVEGGDGSGIVSINGHQIDYSSTGGVMVDGHPVGFIGSLVFGGEAVVTVPDYSYGDVLVNGVSKKNAAVVLTGDTTVTIVAEYCFLAGTRITLANGTQKAIEDVTYDDDLLVWNFDDGKLDHAKPVWLNKPWTVKCYYETTTQSGKKIKTVGPHGHRFFSTDTRTWIYADQIEGHRIYTEDGIDVVVSSVKHDCEPTQFFNLMTDKHINCFADKILAGCSLENGLYPVDENMRFINDGRTKRTLAEFNGEVPEWWFNAFRYADSNLDADYLINYCRPRLKDMR